MEASSQLEIIRAGKKNGLYCKKMGYWQTVLIFSIIKNYGGKKRNKKNCNLADSCASGVGE